MFSYRWAGMLQEGGFEHEFRIHPTQKPIALYQWLLSRYSNPDDIILDTHVGSASSLIACHRMQRKFVGFEIDEEYYRLAKQRLDDEQKQVTFFDLLPKGE